MVVAAGGVLATGHVVAAAGAAGPGGVVPAGGGGNPPPPAYTTAAAHKALDAYVSISSYAGTNTAHFLYSTWLKMPAATGMRLYDVDPNVDANVMAEFLNGNPATLTLRFADATYDSQLNVTLETAPYAPITAWQHILIAGSMNYDVGSRRYAAYINDALLSLDNLNQDYGPSFVLPFNGKLFAVPDTETGNAASDWCDTQMWTGASAAVVEADNTIPEATRRLFYSAAGKPVDPATAAATLGTQSVLYHGNGTAYVVNGGTAGSSTATGTYTTASTSPTD